MLKIPLLRDNNKINLIIDFLIKHLIVVLIDMKSLIMEHEINILIGKKINEIRTRYSISKTVLAKEINITQQQLDKYEKGINRISAARLYLLSKILNVNILYFYSDLLNKKINVIENMKNVGSMDKLFDNLLPADKKTILDILRAMQKNRECSNKGNSKKLPLKK